MRKAALVLMLLPLCMVSGCEKEKQPTHITAEDRKQLDVLINHLNREQDLILRKTKRETPKQGDR